MPKITKKPYKTIGIVGSRRRNSYKDSMKLIEVFEEIYSARDRIVSGGCPKGGDKFAENIARFYGLTITIHHADWNGPLGKGAGLARNTFIAEDCDVLIALVANDRTGGTEHCIKECLKLGKEVICV